MQQIYEEIKTQGKRRKESCSKCIFNPKFRFLGFAMGRNRKGAYIRVHAKSKKKAKEKLRRLTSRSQGRKLDTVFYNIKVFMRGWLGYYAVAEMNTLMERWNEWLRRRIRMYIWKQWKLPRTRVMNLKKLGMPEWMAYRNGNTRKGIGLLPAVGYLPTPLQTKDLYAVDIMTYPKRTSLCTVYD